MVETFTCTALNRTVNLPVFRNSNTKWQQGTNVHVSTRRCILNVLNVVAVGGREGFLKCSTYRNSYNFPDPARKLSANLYDIYHCCVDSEKLLMMDRGAVYNM